MKRSGLFNLIIVVSLALLSISKWVSAEEPIKLTMVGAWPPGVSSAADVSPHSV